MDGTKNDIRREMLCRRRKLTAAAMVRAERSVIARIARFVPYVRAAAVLAYVAIDREVPTARLLESARRDGKRIFLPRVLDDRMLFAEYRPGDTLRPGRFGIGEAAGPPFAWSTDVPAVIFVPLVAWARNGVRLGRGGGYYDRALAELAGKAALVGLGYGFQQRRTLPRDPWDVCLDYVVTERGVVRCGSRGNPALIQKEDKRDHGKRVEDSCHSGSGGGARVGTGLDPQTER